jgi:hypothetical protein
VLLSPLLLLQEPQVQRPVLLLLLLGPWVSRHQLKALAGLLPLVLLAGGMLGMSRQQHRLGGRWRG